MPKGNTKFTKRARDALALLEADQTLGLLATRSGSLFSPVFNGTNFVWMKIMDSDGLMVRSRSVQEGEGAAPHVPVELLVGIILQCEDATSQTKPNPLGKAALSHVRNGVWVDLTGVRRRLDIAHVLMLLPKGAASKHRKSYATAKQNVTNASMLMPDCEALDVARGMSAEKMAEEIRAVTKPWLLGSP